MDLSGSGHSPESIGSLGSEPVSGKRTDRRWTRTDLLLILLLTAAAAVMSLWDLGNRVAPQTYWEPGAAGEGFVADFGEIRQVDRLNLYEGPGARGKTKIEWSADGRNWQSFAEVEHKHNRVFTWKTEDNSVRARYMRFTTVSPGYMLYEAAFFTKGMSAPIPVMEITEIHAPAAESAGSVNRVFDEQEYAPYRPDYRNSMYFDEIYHGRTAYEFLHGIEPYENTHPPLGKVILQLGIQWFGMTPFGWRFMAAIGGTLMIPMMYAAAKGMFGRTRYAFLAALLLLFEGFHLVHSRITNVDIFGVSFTIIMYYAMYRYGEASWRHRRGFRQGLMWLALSGLFFGCAAAVKWNYLYGGAGLAILFFAALLRHYRSFRPEGSRRAAGRAVMTLAAAVIFFIAVPVSVYAASYIPFVKATRADDGINFKDLWQYQKNMYHYHDGVTEEHPYGSKWYTWPLMLRPVWYYGGQDLGPGEAQSIAAIGNPLIWWGGLLAMLASWWVGWRLRDRIVLTIAVMYLSFYVPWAVSPRDITFLYHYFPMVPLLVLSIVWMMRWQEERSARGRIITGATAAAAGFLLVWFYPVLTGMTISREWMNLALRWLPSWGF
jgi:dolichyl-phosphate-mannose--protein O-mannosyl transferase